MSRIIFVSSGKGGAGKSTVCALLGKALADMGQKTLIVELDFGLRGQDVINGVTDKVLFDIEDIFERRCEPIKAIVQSKLSKELFLLPTSNNLDFKVELSSLRSLLKGLSSYYDFLILDSPAGLSDGFKIGGALGDMAIIVTEPSLVSIRDSALCASQLRKLGQQSLRLVINKSPKNFRPTEAIPDYDAIIDGVGAQLLGIIPEDEKIKSHLGEGYALPPESKSARASRNIASRLLGIEADLLIK